MRSGILIPMVSCLNQRFLTLVVGSLFLIGVVDHALAKPHYDSPKGVEREDEIASDATSVPSENSNERDANLAITQPPEKNFVVDELVTKFNKSTYFYPYRQEFELHLGAVFGIRDSSDDKDLMNVLMGFSYMLPRLESPKWKVGADLSGVGHGHLHVVRRKIFNEKGSFRPYYDMGVMHKFVPDEKMASLTNWDNYLARFGVGFADILKPPRSVQLELNVAAGTKDFLVMFTYGYAWGF